MKLFIFSTIIGYAVSFPLTTNIVLYQTSSSKTILNEPGYMQSKPNINRKSQLFYQNPQNIVYWSSNFEILDEKSRVKSSSKIQSLLTNGHSLLIQLRNRATIVENNTNCQLKKQAFTQKLKDALIHLIRALYIARDADLKLGLCDSRESFQAWDEMDKIYNTLEVQPNVNDIIFICNQLETVFDKFQ